MKIIATSADGFMLLANETELEKLANCYYEKDRNIVIKVGQEIPIADMYGQIKFLTEHKNTITQVQEKLAAVIGNLESLKPFVEP